MDEVEDSFGSGHRTQRAPWGDFPKVVRNGNLGSLRKEPEFQAAKRGDTLAAFTLVERLLSEQTIEQLKAQIGAENPLIVPVLATEAAGNNKIPAMMATLLADRLGLGVEENIVQREKVSRTGAGADHRLAFCPTFEGKVIRGQTYIIVDDTLTMGGTIASLRGYIENSGGKVMAASVMTAHEGALDLAVNPRCLRISTKSMARQWTLFGRRNSAMVLTTSPKQKRGTSEQPRVLTQSEIASLRQDMKTAIEWAQDRLRRKREQNNNSPLG